MRWPSCRFPQARVVRDGQVQVIPATDIVPGDVIDVEAGDIIPADGRILRSATLEAQEAALTGESAPIPKDANVLDSTDVGLGDQTNMLFQNTSVTRGTGSMVVTATGMQTQMGQIATMLTKVSRTRSPLQKELDSLTKVLGLIAWGAVAVIVVVGLIRGIPAQELLLLGTAMAISAIPTGLPAFVSGLLSMGAKQLAEAKAVVKNLTDVETLGATSAINTDKTGTLTLNQMMVSTLYANGSWFTVGGEGYAKTGPITSVAGTPVPDFTRLALGLALDTDAVVGDDGSVIGDPTEAALVVLAAKIGVDVEETRHAYPRLAEVPFDSEYKFMATFHRIALDGAEHIVELVKGAPDVVLARCTMSGGPLSGSQVPITEAGPGIAAANERMGQNGLRVLAFAIRLIEGDADRAAMASDPMSLTHDLAFAGMAGIIDPLRAEAKGAVTVALAAGIDVRMITGDHAVTAQAIGQSLGLGPGAISGADLRKLSDDELRRRLPELHVFGRVTPEDKLRLARTMQEDGLIVAMTGDAVNDAAALKQADIGVAMGSGSEVTKQAARMILTDDNFGTLVHAVEIGRRVYDKIVAYVRYQMTQLMSLILLFLAATAFNINGGVALTPQMVLYLLFFATAVGVAIIAVDPGDPDVMHRPPRDPKLALTNRAAVMIWIGYAAALFVAALLPAGCRPGHAKHRSRHRLADHDLRGDGARDGVQRDREPAGPGKWLRPADPEGTGDRIDPGRDAVLGNSAANAATGPADHHPQPEPMADLRRPGRTSAGRRRDQQGDSTPSRAQARPGRRPTSRQPRTSAPNGITHRRASALTTSSHDRRGAFGMWSGSLVDADAERSPRRPPFATARRPGSDGGAVRTTGSWAIRIHSRACLSDSTTCPTEQSASGSTATWRMRTTRRSSSPRSRRQLTAARGCGRSI